MQVKIVIRLAQVEDGDGGLTTYGYDAAGRLITTTLPNGVQTTYNYDDASRLTQLEHQNGTGHTLARFEYRLDGAGNRTTVTETLLAPDAGQFAMVPTGTTAAAVVAEVTGASYSLERDLARARPAAASSPSLASGWGLRDSLLTYFYHMAANSPTPVAQVTVSLERDTLTADGRDGIQVLVLVTDDQGRPVADGTPVLLQANGGTLSAAQASTTNGLVSAWFQAGVTAGSGEVIVQAETVAASAAFTLVAPPEGTVHVDALTETVSFSQTLPFDLYALVEQANNSLEVQPDGTAVITTTAHEAQFDEGQMAFTPLGETTVAVSPSLTVELTSIRVGDQTLFAGPLAAPALTEGNVAAYELSPGLTEEYVARDGGVEQRWTIANDPGVTGDLVVTVAVETALSLSTAEGGEGFVFYDLDPLTGAIVPVANYGQVTAIDAVGRARWAQLRATEVTPPGDELHRYELTLTLPATWLADATYPLVIDPLVGSLLRLDASTTQTGQQGKPAVAYNSDSDEYLIVWQDDRSGNSDIYGQLVTADGLLQEQNFVIYAGTASQTVPDVVYNPDDTSYLVVWREGNQGIGGHRLDADGTLLGSVLVLASGSVTRNYPAVAYSHDAEAWLVTWQEAVVASNSYDILGRAVSSDGTLQTGFIVGNTNNEHETQPDVAANSVGEYLVVWEQVNVAAGSTYDVYARHVTSTTVNGSAFVITTTAGSQVAPAVTYNSDDDEYLVVWQDQANGVGGSGYEAIWARQVQGTAGGGQFVGDPFQVNAVTQTDNATPVVTYFAPEAGGQGHYLVAWKHLGSGGAIDLEARRVLTSGAPSGPTIVLSSAAGDQEDVALALGPVVTATLATWLDERAGNPDIYSRLVETNDTLGSEVLVHPAPGDQDLPQVAYNSEDDEYLAVWHDFRNGTTNADIYAQRVDGAGELIGDNLVVSNTSYHQINAQVAYAPAHDVYLVVWRHYPGSDDGYYDVYGQVVSATGSLVGNPLAIANDSGQADKESPTDVVFNPTSGKFLVLWQDKGSGDWNIWGRHVATDGTMDTPVPIASDSGDNEAAAVAAYNAEDDQYLVVWEDQASGSPTWDILGRRMTGSGVVTTTDTIAIATATGDQRFPDSLYLAPANRYLVVWGDGRNSGTSGIDIYQQLVRPDGTLDGSHTIDSNQTEDERYPRLALSGAGGALIVWQLDEGTASTNNDLYGRRVGSSGLPEDEVFTLLAESSQQELPAIAGNGSSGYFLPWRDNRNSSYDIYGSLFQPLLANFTATPAVGITPLAVQFSDTSTPASVADEWSWSFGDGGTGMTQHPLHTYTQPGVYTVTLTVTDTETGETDSLVRVADIEVVTPTVIQYSYDDLYRLTGASYTGAISAAFSYTYDAVGNMTAYTETVTGTVAVARMFNAANELTSSSDGSGTTTYTYDDNGNLMEIVPPGGDGATRYGYDQRNLLITSTLDSGAGYEPLADFAYDGMGNRLQQVDYSGSQTVTITYTNDIVGLSQVLVADDGTSEVHNLFGLDLISQDEGTATRYLLADGLGSVRTEMEGDAMVAAISYQPYGSVLAQNGTSGSVYGFTGEQEDSSGGLLYLRARNYNPDLRLFMQRDAWEGENRRPLSFNGYLYVYANPSNLTDPSGFDPWWCERWYQRESCLATYVADLGSVTIPGWPTANVWALRALRGTLIDSAQRHNNFARSNLSDNAFAALMAAHLNRESRFGALTNRLLWDIGGDIVAQVLGTNQSTGIANIRPEVATQILRGWIPIEPHLYRQVCPPYTIQGTQYHGLAQQLQEEGLSDAEIERRLFKHIIDELQNQALSIEYLAANIERGVDRAEFIEKIEPSVFNLGNWLWKGVQNVATIKYEMQRGNDVYRHGTALVNDMPKAFQVLDLPATYYNAYNDDEAEFANR